MTRVGTKSKERTKHPSRLNVSFLDSDAATRHCDISKFSALCGDVATIQSDSNVT